MGMEVLIEKYKNVNLIGKRKNLEKGFANQDKWHEDEGKIFRDCIGCFLDLCLFVSVFIM